MGDAVMAATQDNPTPDAPAPTGTGQADTPADQFPANTPVVEMTAPQQVAYWKHQSRRHEGRAASAYGLLDKVGVTDETSALAVAEKAKAADKLAGEKATDTERAAREAREATERELRPQLAAQSVEDSFRLLIGDRKTADEINDFLADLNLSRFIGENGRVDTAKVRARANEYAPATGNQQQQPRRGAIGTAHGSGTTGSTVKASGSDLYDRLHPKKTA